MLSMLSRATFFWIVLRICGGWCCVVRVVILCSLLAIWRILILTSFVLGCCC